MLRISFVATMLAAALFAGPPAAQGQEQSVQLKLAHWVPPSHPLHKAMIDWAASVEKDSGGTIKSTVYPAQQLGKAFDHYDMARDGVADLTYINPGYQPGRFPIIGAGELPFLISDAKGGSQAFDAWYRKYAEREMRDVKFCLAFVHDPGSFHSKNKKIMLPGDIKGMKIRPANATMATFVSQLGGTNVQAGAPELRDVIEKGVADAVTFPWGSILLFGIDKVTKFHMAVPLYVTTFAFVFNKEKYNQMSAAQRKVIDSHCTNEWALKVAAPWADLEHDGIAKFRADPSHEVYELTAVRLAEWKKAAQPLEQSWANNVRKAGVNPEAAMRELRAHLDAKSVAKLELRPAAPLVQPKPAMAAPPTVTSNLQKLVREQVPQPTQLGHRVALVIGNSAYTTFPKIPNPRNDAEDFSKALKGVGFEVSLGTDLNRAGMEDILIKFARAARQADTALIFYAGHGLQHQGINYLAPIDARLDDETDLRKLINLQDVIGDLQGAGHVRILIVDACRDNEAVQQLASRLPATRAAAFTRGLARVEADGTLIAFATQSNRVAADGGGRNSPFTQALLKNLSTPGLELRTLMTRVRAEVVNSTKGSQRPEVWDSLVGEFIFKNAP